MLVDHFSYDCLVFNVIHLGLDYVCSGTQKKKGKRNKRFQNAYLAVFCVDILTISPYYCSINEQTPHDDDHFQHLSQGHLSKHMHANMKAYTRTCKCMSSARLGEEERLTSPSRC